ncbi:cell pole-organizing protein PopZ [Nitrobacteraceae bacterium AZCC 1564]
MTQPAKAQEPSMEEILASIRRIISDDEAKPAASTAPAPPPAKAEVPKPESASRPAQTTRPQVMSGIPPSKIAPPRPPAAARAPVTPSPAAAKNSQADIDAMMASFDAPAPAAKAAPAKPAAPDVEEVFELTEQMAVRELPPTPFNKIEPENDLEFAEASVAQVATHRSPAIEPPAFESAPAPSRAQLDIISGSTASAVESAFSSLTSTVLSNNARTLEDLVKEMMRPMLKSWLDDNLPNLVERIVKAEIERVSRGR